MLCPQSSALAQTYEDDEGLTKIITGTLCPKHLTEKLKFTIQTYKGGAKWWQTVATVEKGLVLNHFGAEGMVSNHFARKV